MRPYMAMLSSRFRLLLQYRAAAIAGFGCQLFFGLIRMMIFAGFYSATTTATPISLDQVNSYIWLGQAFLLLVLLGPDGDITNLINTGNVAYEMLRPADLYGMWFMRTLAARLAPTAMRAAPLLAVATLAGWMHWPGPSAVAAWAASMLAAAVLSAALGTLATITLCWTISGLGATRLLTAAAYFCSGLIVPLPLYPDAWQHVIRMLPFGGLGDLPNRIFAGHIRPDELPWVLAHQLGWTLTLVAVGRLLLARALRRMVVQGG